MSEEKKIDLSSLDGISDRVARAKAKAEAMRAAKAAGGAHAALAAPLPETPPPVATEVQEPPPPAATAAPETAPAEKAEGKVDLSNLDAISDRVARAKAKAEAMRAAKAAGGAHAAPAAAPRTDAPAAERRPKREVSAEAMAAKKAQAKARAEIATPAAPAPSLLGGDGVVFCAGMTIRRNGKLARVVSAHYENVCLVYEDNPREKMMTKRYRLEVERQRGVLQFASAEDFTVAIPPGVGKFGRGLAFLAAAGLTGIFFLGIGLLIGPLNLFPTMLVGYVLFALAHHLTK